MKQCAQMNGEDVNEDEKEPSLLFYWEETNIGFNSDQKEVLEALYVI